MAQPGDAATLARIHAKVFPEGPWDEQFWRETIINRFDTVLLLGDPPRALSAFRLLGDEAEILTIGTLAPRQGDGAALIEGIIMSATAAGVRRLFLEVSTSNKAARALYRRFGFEEAGKRLGYYRDGSDAAILRLVLAEEETDGPS
ncbi:GNAT family N-acetyltransferase [Parvularcula lutaonensis]|uniref:GNAT family N-acetyltransferase n=1 Tax=Parvularcula lutaonensis TaxID=491923 RepID=A0ABV7MCE3_9PROT|nr:GNAT family N-acetyltransferase [Parvularcula lutaonensis]